MIQKSLPKQPILLQANDKRVCASVDLKMKVAATHSVGWMLFAAVHVLDIAGVTGSEKLIVFMSVLVLPLNSAVNPFLHLWLTMTFRSQQERLERLLRVLKSRMIYQSNNQVEHRETLSSLYT